MKKLSPALIAAVRAAKEDGIPAYKLAAEADLDPTVLARLLRGDVRATHRYRDRLLKLARRLGVPEDQVFVEEARAVRRARRRDGADRRSQTPCGSQAGQLRLEDNEADK